MGWQKLGRGRRRRCGLQKVSLGFLLPLDPARVGWRSLAPSVGLPTGVGWHWRSPSSASLSSDLKSPESAFCTSLARSLTDCRVPSRFGRRREGGRERGRSSTATKKFFTAEKTGRVPQSASARGRSRRVYHPSSCGLPDAAPAAAAVLITRRHSQPKL